MSFNIWRISFLRWGAAFYFLVFGVEFFTLRCLFLRPGALCWTFFLTVRTSFIIFWLQPFDARRETQIIKPYANHTMLTPLLTHGASCGDLDLSSSLLIETQKYDLIRSEKLNHYLNGRPQLKCLFKILKFSGHLFRAWRHLHPQFTPTTIHPHFQSGVL